MEVLINRLFWPAIAQDRRSAAAPAAWAAATEVPEAVCPPGPEMLTPGAAKSGLMAPDVYKRQGLGTAPAKGRASTQRGCGSGLYLRGHC